MTTQIKTNILQAIILLKRISLMINLVAPNVSHVEGT